MGLKAGTCPSLGLSQQRYLPPAGRLGALARVPAQGQGWPRGGVWPARLHGLCHVGPEFGNRVSWAFAWLNKPPNDSAKRAALPPEYQSRQYFLVIVRGKCFSHSKFLPSDAVFLLPLEEGGLGWCWAAWET